MSKRKNVLLIFGNPFNAILPPFKNKKAVFPHGLFYLKQSIKNHNCKIIDPYFNKHISLEEEIRGLKGFAPDIIGINIRNLLKPLG